MTLRCIVIEDEPPAMELISRFIGQTPFLHLAGKYFNAIEGLHYVNEQEVDLIFLDIHMPDLSGIELARILAANGAGRQPAIIFTTAHDQFAIEGYKLDVIDYLLKPFEYDEFLRAVNKAVRLARPKQVVQEGHLQEEECLYLKVEYQTVKVPYKDIVRIEGLKDYARFYLVQPERTLLSLVTLKALEEKLPAGRFMRIHKSLIVCVDKITSLSRTAVYIGDQLFTVSDPYKENLARLLESWR